MQLYCPIAATRPADEVSAYARRVAGQLARQRPGQVTDQMARRLRPGKVFIDWSQNNAAKTTVAPYSLRAEPTPSVSTPLTWDEVGAGGALRFSPAQVLARVDRHGDLLAGLLAGGPEIPA
jgi:bifunctional non-homologous end joining protein LigD